MANEMFDVLGRYALPQQQPQPQQPLMFNSGVDQYGLPVGANNAQGQALPSVLPPLPPVQASERLYQRAYNDQRNAVEALRPTTMQRWGDALTGLSAGLQGRALPETQAQRYQAAQAQLAVNKAQLMMDYEQDRRETELERYKIRNNLLGSLTGGDMDAVSKRYWQGEKILADAGGNVEDPGYQRWLHNLRGEKDYEAELAYQREIAELKNAMELIKERTITQEETDRKALTAGVDVTSVISDLERAEELMEAVETGGFERVKLAAADIFGTTPADEGELRSLLNNLVLGRIKMLGSNPTEGERGFIMETVASLSAGGAANKRIIQRMLREAKAQRARGERVARRRQRMGVEDPFHYTEYGLMGTTPSPAPPPSPGTGETVVDYSELQRQGK